MGLCALVIHLPRLAADEFPIISDSTVLGRNYGYPSGTPGSGPGSPGDLDLVFETALFTKNLEIPTMPQQGLSGETFMGHLTPLRLRYRKHERLNLEVGAVLGHNFGDDSALDVADPLLRVVYQPLPHQYIVAGTLLRTHWIHDALYDDVFAFRENAEQGFQYRADLTWLKQDAWIHWRIRETDLRSERFELGSTTRFVLGNLWLDGQVYWAHVGGQRNSEHRVENNPVVLIGGSYGFPAWPLDGNARIGAHYFYDYEHVPGTGQATTGDGCEIRTTFDTHPCDNVLMRLFGTYFAGNELRARRGDPLYSVDRYFQVGTSMVFCLIGGLRAEIGIVGQWIDDEFAHTYQLHFYWGDTFRLISGCNCGPCFPNPAQDAEPMPLPPPWELRPAPTSGWQETGTPRMDGWSVNDREPDLLDLSAVEDSGVHQDPQLLPVTRLEAAGTDRLPLTRMPPPSYAPPIPFQEQLPVDSSRLDRPESVLRYEIFPEARLWDTPLANQREPRFSAKFSNANQESTIDTAIGAVFGLGRWGPCDNPRQGCQLDAFAAVFTRFNQRRLLKTADYRVGVPFTFARGPWQMKLSYEHTSTHLGDEFIHDTGSIQVAHVRDEAVLGLARRFRDTARVYGQFGYSFATSPLVGDDRDRFDWGVEWICPRPLAYLECRPFVAFDMDLRSDQDYAGNVTLQIGGQWTAEGRSGRLAIEYYTGKSPYGQLFLEDESWWSFSASYDL